MYYICTKFSGYIQTPTLRSIFNYEYLASNYQYIYIGNYHYVDKYLPITINLWVNSALSISTYFSR